MQYVTYDPATGDLTGAFIQDLLPEHEASHIEVPDADYARWTSMEANAARDGVQDAPAPSPPPTPVPQSVAMWKARTVLLDVDGVNLNPVVDQLIATLPEPHKSMAQMKWDYAGFVDRTDSLVLALIQQIPLTEERADALFIQTNDL